MNVFFYPLGIELCLMKGDVASSPFIKPVSKDYSSKQLHLFRYFFIPYIFTIKFFTMRRIAFLIGVLFSMLSANAQNVGIGTTTPDPLRSWRCNHLTAAIAPSHDHGSINDIGGITRCIQIMFVLTK